jgi:RNA polymerase sigma-54 factor
MQIQKPEFRQVQKLKLSPQLFQAIKIMALPIQELRTAIREEIEKNPALEIIEDRTSDSYDEVSTETQAQTEEENFFEETSDSGFISRERGDSDAKRKFMEGVLTRPETLHDHLLWQLHLQAFPPDWYRIGELLIQNLDDNGFHRESPESLVPASDYPTLYKLIDIIQGFDPPGVCTKDHREALLAQVKRDPNAHPDAVRLIEGHLDRLEKGKTKEVAKELGMKEEEIKGVLEYVKTLEPIPGRNFCAEEPRYVIPDLRVTIVEGEFMIRLNDEEIPVLGINPFFNSIKDDAARKKEKDLKTFVTQNINDAKWFIKSINQRNEKLVKVCRAIVEFQREFFRKGQQYLVPLTLKDIAAEVGVHEATVSRITTGKYVQTEWGVFELKYFFTNSISGIGSGGSRFSKEGVKQIIKEMIQKEERNLSDNEIVDILANRGIKIARRTISKYRHELGILSSFDRKK